MRIAMVHQPWNPSVPPINAGSIAIWIYESGNRLAATDEITAFARTVRGQPRSQDYAGVRYERSSIWPDPDRLPGRIISALRSIKGLPQFAQPDFYSGYRDRVAKQISAAHFDIVHTHNLITYPSAFKAASNDSKTVLHMHCEWLSQIPRELALELVEPVSQLLACSGYLAQHIDDHLGDPGKKCLVMPNGVDVDHFSPPDPSSENEAKAKEILFVGRISPEKGLHDLITAFGLVQNSCPDAVLRIVGPHSPTPIEFLVEATSDPRVAELAAWYDRDYLVTLRGMAGDRLGKSIIFQGNVPHVELPALYRRASVLANPSVSESFGMSLIEAFACGCPVVATRAGGMTDIVDDGETGYLVNTGDTARLAEALHTVLSRDDLRNRMRLNARKVAVGRYSWARIAEDLRNIYVQL